MSNTYTALHYHLVFSTKNRVPYLTQDIEQRVWAYIGGVARGHSLMALQIGGFDDHIHALLTALPTLAPSKIAQYLKGNSSKWIHETFPELQDFAWQEGYGAFTISKSGLDAAARYIQGQRAHHQQQSFQDEYREFLQKHGIEYDERHLWG